MSEKQPEVVEHGGYSGGGKPTADTTSFDKRTPAGGDAYRVVADEKAQDDHNYVIGLDGPQNVSEGPFLDRDKLARGDGQATVFERADKIDPYKLAGAGLVVVLLLGAVGLYVASTGPNQQIRALEEIAPSELTAGEATNREVDGVKVRSGMQRRALAPAGEERGKLNAVPTGERIPDGSQPSPSPSSAPTPKEGTQAQPTPEAPAPGE